MAAIVKGTAFKYGTSAAGATLFTGVVVQTYKDGDEFAVKVEAKDADGKVITRRWDDRTKKLSFTSLIPDAATLPVIGDVLTFGTATKFVVEKIDVDGKNDGNTIVTVEGVTSEGVTLT